MLPGLEQHVLATDNMTLTLRSKCLAGPDNA